MSEVFHLHGFARAAIASPSLSRVQITGPYADIFHHNVNYFRGERLVMKAPANPVDRLLIELRGDCVEEWQ